MGGRGAGTRVGCVSGYVQVVGERVVLLVHAFVPDHTEHRAPSTEHQVSSVKCQTPRPLVAFYHLSHDTHPLSLSPSLSLSLFLSLSLSFSLFLSLSLSRSLAL